MLTIPAAAVFVKQRAAQFYGYTTIDGIMVGLTKVQMKAIVCVVNNTM